MVFDTMDVSSYLINDLQGLPATVTEVDYLKRGYHLEVLLRPDQVREFAEILRGYQFYLVFVSAVHLQPYIEITYQFASFSQPLRLVGRSPATTDGTIPSIADIFNGANWHERETRDMFGVIFSGHPYLEPLLLAEEDADLRPLLKQEGSLKPEDAVRWLPQGAIKDAITAQHAATTVPGKKPVPK